MPRTNMKFLPVTKITRRISKLICQNTEEAKVKNHDGCLFYKIFNVSVFEWTKDDDISTKPESEESSTLKLINYYDEFSKQFWN